MGKQNTRQTLGVGIYRLIYLSLSHHQVWVSLDHPRMLSSSNSYTLSIRYTDTKTGADNYKAIRMFFDTFTYYRGRAFWIAGESYAGNFTSNIIGMYIPYTASALVSGEVTVPEEDKINIKGIMIGNGVLVMNDEFRDKAATSFLTRRNFIDKTNQFILDHQCNINANSASCKIAKASLNKALDQINPYNVYGYCWSDSTSAEFKVPHSVLFYKIYSQNILILHG